MGRALSADKASALRPTRAQGLCKHPDVPRQPSERGLKRLQESGSLAYYAPTVSHAKFWFGTANGIPEPCYERISGHKYHLPARSTYRLSHSLTHSNRLDINNNNNQQQPSKPNAAFSTAVCYLNYQAQTSPATSTATDCVTQAEISPSLNST
jgi:hypothetical protein